MWRVTDGWMEEPSPMQIRAMMRLALVELSNRPLNKKATWMPSGSPATTPARRIRDGTFIFVSRPGQPQVVYRGFFWTAPMNSAITKPMRPFISFILFFTTVAAAVLFLSSSVFADDEVCGACDKKVVVTGQYDHGTSDTFLIANAPGNEAAFRDEIHGKNFSLAVPDLVAGKYTVEIGLVELRGDHVGQRVFDILCGDQLIATNLDIFAVAGGKDKVIRIRAEISHPGGAA